MKFSVFIKRLSHPQVIRRLKIGLSVWALAILISLLIKLAYDIGYFKAQSLIDEKNAAAPSTRQVLTIEAAQLVVTGALKEDPSNPKTIVTQVVDNNQKLSTVIIENNKQKKIGWIIDMRLFFTGDLFNDQGYNLTQSIQYQHNIHSENR
ncbi:MAG: hypothetical protein CTY19_00075 [Methylomonas sp.]|jgi:hypothetical protein|nr:MAG: hypothetical protein CTY19_00075 [Methylomonas sp.]